MPHRQGWRLIEATLSEAAHRLTLTMGVLGCAREDAGRLHRDHWLAHHLPTVRWRR